MGKVHLFPGLVSLSFFAALGLISSNSVAETPGGVPGKGCFTSDPRFPGELELVNNAYQENSLSVQNDNAYGYSAYTVHDDRNIEHLALGWANSRGVAGGEGSDDYLEISNFGGRYGTVEGPAPDFWLLQSGTVNNIFKQRRHILFGGTSGYQDIVYDYQGTNKDLILDRKTGLLTLNIRISSTGTMPVLSSCGTPSEIVAGSTSTKGTISEGVDATGCKINFVDRYQASPTCIVSSPTGAILKSYTTTPSYLEIMNSSSSRSSFSYICIQ